MWKRECSLTLLLASGRHWHYNGKLLSAGLPDAVWHFAWIQSCCIFSHRGKFWKEIRTRKGSNECLFILTWTHRMQIFVSFRFCCFCLFEKAAVLVCLLKCSTFGPLTKMRQFWTASSFFHADLWSKRHWHNTRLLAAKGLRADPKQKCKLRWKRIKMPSLSERLSDSALLLSTSSQATEAAKVCPR